MKVRKLLYLFSLLSMASMLACSKSGNPVSPEPEPEPEPKPEAYISITDRTTKKEVTALEASYSESEIYWIIRSNVNWSVEEDGCADWLSIELSQNILLKVHLSVNTSALSRGGTIRFKNADSGDILAEIQVTQSHTESIGKSDFSDMVLLEYDRTEADYRGYLLYNKDGRVQWLFDAICIGSGRYNGQSIGEAEGNAHLDKEMTTNLMNEYFEDGKYISKINNVIESIKPSVPGKFVRKKIVLTIPLIVSEDWGELDGVKLYPSNESEQGRVDRVTIAKWFVDECLKKFAEKEYENLQLIGFYWQEENGRIWEENGMMISDYIHSYGLNFYWVPWYNAYNNTKWKDYGFDATWLQPNYLFYEEQYPDKSQLYNAYDKALANDMYLEMELDNLRSLQRQIEYWDVYEEKGVLENWPLVYYESGSMFPSRENIIDPDWKSFHERVAKDIADRQKKFYNYE